MMKRITFLVLIPLFFFQGCKKETSGCTDSEAINYNSEASLDNGTCQFVSDLYEGSYLFNDTTYYYDPNDSSYVEFYTAGGFLIESTGKSTIQVSGYRNNTIYGTVTTSQFHYQGTSGLGNILYNYLCVKTDNKLTYSYLYTGFADYTVRGVAFK